MATFDTLTLAVPAHWATAIVYGDTSGLDTCDAKAFSRWLYDFTREFGNHAIGEVSECTHFARYHDAAEYGVLACDCVDVQFLLEPLECIA